MRTEKILKEASLVYLVRRGRVLMGWKLRHIGADNWNGYGGGRENGETMAKCAVREVFAESGIRLRPKDLDKAAIIRFHNTTSSGSAFVCAVHVYLVHSWRGKARPGDEMADPTEFRFDRLPRKMLAADHVFLPLILKGKRIVARFRYGPHQEKLTALPRFRYVKKVPER